MEDKEKLTIQCKCVIIQKTESNDAVVLGGQEGKLELPMHIDEADKYFQRGKLYNITIEEALIVKEPRKPLVKLQ